MALMDEFREERDKIKNAPLKTKIGYIVDYYKWPIIGVVAAVIIITSFIYNQVTKKEDALNGMLINTTRYGSTYSVEQYESLYFDILQTLNLDPKEYQIELNTSVSLSLSGNSSVSYYDSQSLTVLMTRVGAETIDFLTGNISTMQNLAYRGYLEDLTNLLSEEDYLKYEPYFLYIDNAIIKELQENTSFSDDETLIEYPDCDKPETMKEPIPVMIDMSECKVLPEIYNHPEDEALVFGITINAPHVENTTLFLEYLMKQ